MTINGVSGKSPRTALEELVGERAAHATLDKVSDTRSFANMERTLTREYWGRFLIELIQNARDAWLAGSGGGQRGLLRVRLTRDPALVVCNEGEAMSVEVVLHSISKFGESPKKYGTAIGHKGIGFKAVLELTRTPRIYSRADPAQAFDLQVRFDPDEARDLVLVASPHWKELVSSLPSAGAESDDDRIPVLRFPMWDDKPPAWLGDVAALNGRPFNTVVALPYDARFSSELALTADEFIQRAQQAIQDLTDEVLLLLEVFDRVVIEDEVAGSATEVRREATKLAPPAPNLRLHQVAISRDDVLSSRWWVYEASLPDHEGLEGDIAVAVRVGESSQGRKVPLLPAGHNATGEVRPADCFHLFFPTQIPTHLPFLLHAYFEVDAGRKRFAEDRSAENRARLAGLMDLVLAAVDHLVSVARAGEMDISELPDLFAACDGSPDDPLAAEFRHELLAALDVANWVEVRGDKAGYASPNRLLVDSRSAVQELLPTAFPPAYVEAQLGRWYVSDRVAEPGRLFLARRNAISRDLDVGGLDAATLSDLLRPSNGELWAHQPDEGFRALLKILDLLKRGHDMGELLDSTRGDPSATFIPVLDPTTIRRLRQPSPRRASSVIDEEEDLGGILARVSAVADSPLIPPQAIGVDFLADGVVDADLLAGICSRIGIRPYQTESILDALAGATGLEVDAADVLRFMWRLLLRERLSSFSVAQTLRQSVTFDPGRWFWSRPGSNRADGARDLRRVRALSSLLLPSVGGQWRPATELVFGAEWAEWIAEAKPGHPLAASGRAAAYRDLAAAAPALDTVIGSPTALAAILPLEDEDVRWVGAEDAPDLPGSRHDRHRLLLHAFLLRLGVWEIPPLEGYVDHRHPRPIAAPPWAGLPAWDPYVEVRDSAGAAFSAFAHQNTYVAEDYRLRWDPTPRPEHVRSMARGARFYARFFYSQLFCPQCRSHGNWHSRRYSSVGDPDIPSFVRWQLTQSQWVPTSVGGASAEAARPSEAWLEEDPPDEARMQQSWMRYLPIVSRDVSPELATLVGVARLRDAEPEHLTRLLASLREQFDGLKIAPDRRATSFEGQAFIGLHRRIYEQLARADHPEPTAETLVTIARDLTFRAPADARHDDGEFSAYKRYFLGQVPFSVLPRDAGPVADALGIPRFRLELQRLKGGAETKVTSRVAEFIHERAAELLALQVYHPLGTQPLQIDSRAFVLRADRLRRLEVVQVDDLVLRAELAGSDLSVQIGAGRTEDLFLDLQGNPPVLYHDLKGANWEERFRAVAGPHLAALLENAAYGATFQLLLQQETAEELETFMDEQSISEDDVDVIRSQIDLAMGVVRAEERRWWAAVLVQLGGDAPSSDDADDYRRQVREALESIATKMGIPELASALLRGGAGEAARRDVSADGPLQALENAGVSLAELDATLRQGGDQGLTIQVAERLLSEWRRSHGREVTVVLIRRGMAPDEAKTRPDRWATPAALRFRIGLTPEDYLADPIAELAKRGLTVEPGSMIGSDASRYLASLVASSPEELAAEWRALFSQEDRARLDYELAARWRQLLRPVIVADRTRTGEATHLIRLAVAEVDRTLGTATTVGAVAHRLEALLEDSGDLCVALTDLIDNSHALSPPAASDIREAVSPFIDLAHFDRVVAVIRRGRRAFLDQVRGHIEQVKAAGLAVKPFTGSREPTPRPPKRQAHSRVRVGARRAHDQRARDRLGVQGERAALAAVMAAILDRPMAEQDSIIVSLIDLLVEVAEGEIVDGLVADGRAAMAATDEDDRVEALAKFLWVADRSDDFGFDLLGYLPPYASSPSTGLLLEVKNSADRSFLVSTAEWQRAEQQGERYAFLVVLRSESSTPAGIELVPDPVTRLARGEVNRSADTWKVSYAAIDAPSPV